MNTRLTRLLLTASAVAALAACGGGDDETAMTEPGTPPAGSAGTLTISAAVPARHNGTLDLSTAEASGNEARAADGAIATPYCAVTFDRVTHSANTDKYYVTVYFRQSDGKVLNAGVFVPAQDWAVGDFNATAGISGVTVDVATRTVTFSAKAMSDIADPSNVGTVDGSFTFPANSSVAACGR